MGNHERPKTADHVSTRIIGHRTLTVDGVKVEWWAVGDNPALVTVRTSAFGSLAEFTNAVTSEFARTLAQKLLAKHNKRPTAPLKKREAKRSGQPVMKKPGWFEPGEDFSSTGF